LDDADLVAAAQRGDRAALDQLLRRHYDRIAAVCRRVTGRHSDAEDATQEAVIKIVRALPRFDGRSAFGTWAYRIATNAALDELRKRARRPPLHIVEGGADHGGERDSGPHVVDGPVDQLADRQIDAVADRLSIDAALARLDDDFRTPVVLRDVIDLDYAEIAEVLDIPLGTVKSRIARGRAMLVTLLHELPEHDQRTRAETRVTSTDSGNQTTDSRRPNQQP
jgi:RNA polymerase sigma-70 factor (ECF subfamily)